MKSTCLHALPPFYIKSQDCCRSSTKRPFSDQIKTYLLPHAAGDMRSYRLRLFSQTHWLSSTAMYMYLERQKNNYGSHLFTPLLFICITILISDHLKYCSLFLYILGSDTIHNITYGFPQVCSYNLA